MLSLPLSLRSISSSRFLIWPLMAIMLLFAASGTARAQVGVITSSPSGPVTVGSSGTFQVTWNFSGPTYVYSIDYMTNGSLGQSIQTLFGPTDTYSNGLEEYTFAGTTCQQNTGLFGGGNGNPSSCTATVSFTPQYPGARPGALILRGNYSGNGAGTTALAYVYLNGTATGPQAVFANGVPSSVVTGLTSAAATAVNGAGDIYFTDQGAKTLSVLRFGSTTPTVLVSNINAATGVAVDGVGNVYYGAYGDNLVYKIPFDGSATTSFSVTSPDIGMAVDNNSNVYVASGSSVSEIAANATTATTVATVAGHSVPAVAVDRNGNVFFTDFTASKIYEVPSGGTVASALTTVDGSGVNELSGPRGIAVDANGDLYVANQTGNSILRLLNGTWTQSVVASGSAYGGLSIDANGSLYTALGTTIVKDDRTTPGTLTFSPVVLGTPSTQQAVTLENDGTTALTISSLTTGTTNADTGGAATTCSTTSTVGAGAQCVLGVRFNPTQATTTTGTVTITDNSDGNATNKQLIHLTGSTANDPQTITFAQASAVAPNTTATLSGSASSGLKVSYSIVSGSATISTNQTTITYGGAGAVVIQATQAGNTNYAAATAVNSTVQVVAPPIIAFTPAATGLVGSTVTLSATSNQSATPITFSIVSGTATLNGSQLTFTTSGTVVVAASQAGTANYPAGQTQASIQVYTPQTINFSPVTPAAPGSSTVLSANATSGLPVAFAVASGPATITNSGNTYTITYNAVGTVVITASQAGNGTYAAASNVQGTVAVVARPVITFTTATPVTLGSTATLSATSTQSGTPIIFTIVGGAATLSGSSITYTYAEPVVIEADQAGTANYPAALPVQATVNVIGATATTTLAATSGGAPASSVASGTVVTLTASVSVGGTAPAQGKVTFCDAPTVSVCTFLHVLGTAQLRSGANAGTAIFRYTPGIGSHNFFAIFGPTQAYAKSSSAAVPVAVDGDNTTTLIAQSGSAGNYTLTGTVVGSLGAIPAGNVNFLDESNNFGPLASVPLVAGSSTTSFSVVSHPAVTGMPLGVVTADFDGDGILDLATANSQSGTITAFKGGGDGSFNVVSSPATGAAPNGIATGDFNGDGIPDLVTANEGGDLTILLGTGNGTFSSASAPTNVDPILVAVGEFNGDGIADLVVVGDNGTEIRLGNGDGTFHAGATIGVGNLTSVVTGDFNGDGITDLAFGDNSSTHIFLGHGDGTFTQSPDLPCGGDVAVSDFNGDGIADVAALQGSLCTFLGKGDGTFTSLGSTGSFNDARAFSTGDFNGDGIPDLVIEDNTASPQQFSNTVVLLGKGDGTFPTVISTVLSNTFRLSSGLAVGDFNKDGLSDYAAVTWSNQDNDPTYNDYSTVFLSSASSTATATVTGINPTGTGTHNVAAFYSGEGPYTPSVSTTTPLTASNLLPNTISFPALASPVNVGDTATLSATSTSGSVTYTITAGTATLSGANITYTTGGTVQITANSAATSTYAAATPVSVTVTVSFAQAYFSWQPSTLSIYTGTPLGTSVLDATYSIPGTIGYTSALQPSGTATTALSSTILSAGSYILAATATPSVSGYAVNTESLPFTVQNMNVFTANSVGSVSSLFNIGTVQSSATTGGGIGAAVDSNGNVWSISADGNSIQKFTDYGAIAASYNSTGISGAKALVLDGGSNIWVANGNGSITVLNNTGAARFTIPGSTASAASAIAIDKSGNAWLTNPTTNSVDEILGGAAPVDPLSIAVTLGKPATQP